MQDAEGGGGATDDVETKCVKNMHKQSKGMLVSRRCVSAAASLPRRRHLCSLPPLTTTRSGLMFRDVLVGEGRAATAGDQVAVDYTGRLEDGTVFDSSEGRGPISFTIGMREVIKGWEEGITGMHVGGKRQLVLPPHLGYGAQGAPPAIPPNALLHFDVELQSASAEAEQGGMFSRLMTLLKALPIK